MNKSDIIREEYYKDPTFNRRKLARKLNVRESYIRAVIRPLKKNTIEYGHKPVEEKIEFNKTSQNTAKLNVESLTITTVKQALETAQVDLTMYEELRHTIGSYQVTMKLKEDSGERDKQGRPIYNEKPYTRTMYKTQVWLKKIPGVEWVQAIRNLITDLPKLKTPKRNFKLDGKYMLEVALVDQHFGMFSWAEETGFNYDIKIAENLYLNGIQDLICKAQGYKPSLIVIPIGNDFMHVSDDSSRTPLHGNPLDTDTRQIKIYQTAKKAIIKAVHFARTIAPVRIIYVPGNHDFGVSYAIADVIAEVFKKDPEVTVDSGPKTRKFLQFGKNMIAFTHGHDTPIRDLPNILSCEEPEMFGRTKYREAHLGHFHGKRTVHWTGVDSNRGWITRVLPSLCPPDQWHYRKGFIKSHHACSSLVFEKDTGLVAEFHSYGDKILNRNK